MLEKPELELLHSLQGDEFLPPIRRWTTLGALVLVGILAGTVGLAAVIRYNVTVQAPANVRPVDELSLVQATREGTIQRILVRENQLVRQGDVLAEIGVPPRSQLQAQLTRRNRLQRYVQQYQQQLEQTEIQLRSLNAEIIVQSGLLPSSPALTTDPTALTEADVDAALERLTTTAPTEAKRLAEQRDRLQQQRTSLANQIRYDQSTLQTLDSQLSGQVILAPIDGTILKLSFASPGQPLRPGDVVAQIVPQRSPLVVKARVSVQDISQVQIGQAAQLRVSAYPYPDYGTLHGTVQAIAPDAVTAEGGSIGSLMAYYEVTIQPDQTFLLKDDRPYPIQPGMEVRADIISRQETLLQSVFRRLRLWSDL